MNTEKVRQAEEFARVCHEGQFLKGIAREPYTVHLEEVDTSFSVRAIRV